MPRTNRDETWRKEPDGTMTLVSSVERIVSDEELKVETREEWLKAEVGRASLSNDELLAVCRELVAELWP